MHVLSELNCSTENIECQWLELKFWNQRNVIVCNVYRQPQGNVRQYLDHIENCLEQIDYIRKGLFIIGNMNIDILDSRSPNVKDLKEFLSQNGLVNHIKTISRYANTKNSCLGHIYSNCNIINNCGTLDLHLSDHIPVFVNRKKANVLHDKVEFTGRSYRDYDTFTEELQSKQWNSFDLETNPNRLWQIVHNNVYSTLDILHPTKNFSVKKYKEPWITNELLEEIRDKDLALKKAKKSGKDLDWIVARRLRNDCLSHIRKARCEFVQNEFNNDINDSKQFWRNVNEVWPNKKSNSSKITLINQDTNVEIKQEDTAEFINQYFTNIGPSLAQNFNEPWNYGGVIADRHIDSIEVNEIEILKICKEIDINKSSSIPNISCRILRDSFISQIKRIGYLIKQIFSTGIFPDIWKIANITPLQKDGNVHSVNNLRPISLLPLPSKIVEKIIHDRMMHHLEQNMYLDINQGGFRKNNSTINTVTYFTNDIFNGFNNRELTVATYIDMAKAFDTVNHEVLLKKLYNLGFSGKLLKLLQNYLENRKQRTTVHCLNVLKN